MKTAPELLRIYLDNIQTPAVAAAVFAEEGVLELPTLKAFANGPEEIEGRFQNLRTVGSRVGRFDSTLFTAACMPRPHCRGGRKGTPAAMPVRPRCIEAAT